MYRWLQAFHDLQWRGKPDRQIGSTHWQKLLQADAQHTAICGLGPTAKATALDVLAPGRTLAPHTVSLAKLSPNTERESSVRKSVTLPPARGATEPTTCPMCAEKFHTSGAMMEHLVWHAVHAPALAEDREAASNILGRKARRSPSHAPYAQHPPPPPRRPATQRPRRREKLRPMPP